MKSMAGIHLEYGNKVQVEEIDIPDPLETQVIVKLKSTGVCHSQLHQMNNAETSRPISLGHEGAGYVEKVGKNVRNRKCDAFRWKMSISEPHTQARFHSHCFYVGKNVPLWG